MSTTRHRNAGGPFVVFDPGLGVTGSLEVKEVFKVGASHAMNITQNEIDISSGNLTLDVEGNIVLDANGGTVTFADDGVSLGTITSAGYSGTSAVARAVAITDNESTDENNKIIFGAGAAGSGNIGLEADGDLTYNPSTGTIDAKAIRLTKDSTGPSPQIHIHEDDADGFGRLGFTNTADTNGSLGSYSHEWVIAGKAAAQAEPANALFNIFYGDADGDGTGGDILSVRGDKKVGINDSTPSYELDVNGQIRATSGFVGNSTSATALASGRTLKVNLESTAASTAFDGSANITDIGVSGELPIANGGTGAANAATALSNLGAQPLHADLTALSGMQTGAAAALANLTSTEIKLLDGSIGGTSTITIADTDGFLMRDGTTMRLVKAESVLNYTGGGSSGLPAGLTFTDDCLTIDDPGSTAKTILNVGEYSSSSPGAGSGNAKPVVGIKQIVNNASENMAIGMTTSDGSYGFYMGLDSSGNLDIRSDMQGSGTHPHVYNGVQIPRSTGNQEGIETSVIAFTGYHRNIPTDDSLQEYKDNHIGKIVVSDGTYQNLETDLVINKPLISQALPKIRLASKRNQKSCFGVVASIEEEDKRYYGYGGQIQSYIPLSDEDRRVIVNSLGEGGIWICNINGNLENGDYITTCEVPGLGMKQDSEMLCNYTVAKITQDCNFRKNAKNYDVKEFEFEGKTYRKAFVGCTYHCG